MRLPRPRPTIVRSPAGAATAKHPFRRFSVVNGITTVQSEELDRIELRLGGGQGVTGYMRSGNTLAPLPIGSAFNASTGVFTWQPGVGFVGSYDLAFVRWAGGRAVSRQDVRVVLNAKGSNQVGPQVVIDLPSKNDRDISGRSFIVRGGPRISIRRSTAASIPCTCGRIPRPAVIRSSSAPRRSAARVPTSRRSTATDLVSPVTELRSRGLAPGTYDIAVFAYSTVADGFVPAKTVRVRGPLAVQCKIESLMFAIRS